MKGYFITQNSFVAEATFRKNYTFKTKICFPINIDDSTETWLANVKSLLQAQILTCVNMICVFMPSCCVHGYKAKWELLLPQLSPTLDYDPVAQSIVT